MNWLQSTKCFLTLPQFQLFNDDNKNDKMTKISIRTALLLLISLLGVSCNNTQQRVANPSDDASIVYLQLMKNNKELTVLNTQFTIDNVKNEIYNVDSLPYGTEVDSLYIGIRFASTLGYIMNDTISESYLNNRTANTYDLTKPVTIKNLATDAKTTKTYTLNVNVHTVSTYKHVWTQLNSGIVATAGSNQKAFLLHDSFYFIYQQGTAYQLYSSTDATRWSKGVAPTGLPDNAPLSRILIKGDSALLLVNNQLYHTTNANEWLKENIEGDHNYDYNTLLFFFKGKLWALATHKTKKTIKIASSVEGKQWVFVDEKVFEKDFPIADFTAVAFQPKLGREKVIVIGGKNVDGKTLNTRWTAENILHSDKLNWVDLQYLQQNSLPISSAAVSYYGGKLLLVGGVDTNQGLLGEQQQLQQSVDEGLTWTLPDSTTNLLPQKFIHRSNTSVIQHDNSLYIIGGKGVANTLSDVWRVRVNFYDFKDASKY